MGKFFHDVFGRVLGGQNKSSGMKKRTCVKYEKIFSNPSFSFSFSFSSSLQEFVNLAIHLFQGTDRNLETSAMFITHRMRMGEDTMKVCGLDLFVYLCFISGCCFLVYFSFSYPFSFFSQKAMRKTYGNLRHAPICFFTKKKIEGHAKSKKIPARFFFFF